jgi:hypothetical protein
MSNFKKYIIEFIEENIGEYNEIHVSKYLSDKIEQFDNFEIYDGEQSIVGDTYVGDLVLSDKIVCIYYNVLYENDDIEFKQNEEIEYEE